MAQEEPGGPGDPERELPGAGGGVPADLPAAPAEVPAEAVVSEAAAPQPETPRVETPASEGGADEGVAKEIVRIEGLAEEEVRREIVREFSGQVDPNASIESLRNRLIQAIPATPKREAAVAPAEPVARKEGRRFLGVFGRGKPKDKAAKGEKKEQSFYPSKNLRRRFEREVGPDLEASGLVKAIDNTPDDRLKALADFYLDGKGRESGSPAQIRERLKNAVAHLQEEKAREAAVVPKPAPPKEGRRFPFFGRGRQGDKVTSGKPEGGKGNEPTLQEREMHGEGAEEMRRLRGLSNEQILEEARKRGDIDLDIDLSEPIENIRFRLEQEVSPVAPKEIKKAEEVVAGAINELSGQGAGVPDEVVKKTVDELKDKTIFNKPVIGFLASIAVGRHLKTQQFVAGAAAGFILRTAVRTIGGTAGMPVTIAAGAIAGGGSGAIREYLKQRGEKKSYKSFVESAFSAGVISTETFLKMREELQTDIASLGKDFIGPKKPGLKKEELRDKLRYLNVAFKKQSEGGEKTLASRLDEYFKEANKDSIGNAENEDRKKLLVEIYSSKLSGRIEMGWAIVKGAGMGALGATAAGFWMEFAEANNINLVSLAQNFAQEHNISVPATGGVGTTVREHFPGSTPGTTAPGAAAATGASHGTLGPDVTHAPSQSVNPDVTHTPPQSPTPDATHPAGPSAPPDTAPTGQSAEEIAAAAAKKAAQEAAAGGVIISPEVAKLPDTISLPGGSNPWNEVSKSLKEILGRDPTNAEILRVTKAIAKESGIKVESWGLTEGVDQRALPVGFELKITPGTKTLIQQMVEGKLPPEVPEIPKMPSVPVEGVVPKVPDLPPELKALPETVHLPKGTNGLNAVNQYLEGALGEKPTQAELLRMARAVVKESGSDFIDKTAGWGSSEAMSQVILPADIDLKFTPVMKKIIQELIEAPSLGPKLAGLSENVPLLRGVNGTATIARYFKEAFGREPTLSELIKATRAVAKASGIDFIDKTAGWGSTEATSQVILPKDTVLKFTPKVKGLIQRIFEASRK